MDAAPGRGLFRALYSKPQRRCRNGWETGGMDRFIDGDRWKGIVVAAVLVLGFSIWLLRSGSGASVEITQRGSQAANTQTAEQQESVFVHVAGAVRNPGLYELDAGARAYDAIQAAGGPKRKADLSAINLARVISDGDQLLVPAKGARARPLGTVSSAAESAPGDGLVDVNRATADELTALPGIGPVLADAIVRYREENGPFVSVDDMQQVDGIGPKRLEQLRDKVVIR